MIKVTQNTTPLQPVTIVLDTPIKLANLLGALIAYGRAEVYAENNLKAVGLGKFYSGNVRAAARQMALDIAGAVPIVQPPPDFEDYLNSGKFRSSHPSKAGDAVIGTEEDLAPGREESHFEDGENTEEIDAEQEYPAEEYEEQGSF